MESMAQIVADSPVTAILDAVVRQTAAAGVATALQIDILQIVELQETEHLYVTRQAARQGAMQQDAGQRMARPGATTQDAVRQTVQPGGMQQDVIRQTLL